MPTPGPNAIKVFTSVIYEFSLKLVFVPGKLFQPSLMFKEKARAYSGKALFMCSILR
jgi:hypothetical protein